MLEVGVRVLIPLKTELDFFAIYVDYFSILWYGSNNRVGRNISKSYKMM